jgi:hypothetical protein
MIQDHKGIRSGGSATKDGSWSALIDGVVPAASAQTLKSIL